MAIQIGAIQCVGSFKSIRNYRIRNDKRIFAGEKGGANRDLIMNNPAFKNTRLNENEFGGCARAVKGIRIGFVQLLPEMVDSQFTSRLMKMTRQISTLDKEGESGKRSICFSAHRDVLRNVQFHKSNKTAEMSRRYLGASHSDSRVDTSLIVENLSFSGIKISKEVEKFRLISHLSIVSDYQYSDMTNQYEPTNPLDGLCAYAYSEYASPNDVFTTDLHVSFPAETVIGADCSVIHCVGIEFYIWNGIQGYKPTTGQSLTVINVF